MKQHPFSDYSLDQWVDYIQSIHHRSIDLTLDRVKTVYQHMSIDFADAVIITLGGTNGKGSSQAMLESIYSQQGYQTACYSSPHLVDYNERIKIANKPIDNSIICQAFCHIETARGDIPLTYFEFGTLAAFWIYSQAYSLKLIDKPIDVIILETGMGGRQDAVNVVDPDIVLITNIGLDHVQWLGNDRESIGYEKAGLFKKDIPAVCNDSDPPKVIAKVAKQVGAPLYQLGEAYSFSREKSTDALPNDAATWQLNLCLDDNRIKKVALPIPNIKGEAQLQNAAAVLTVVQLLCNKIKVSDASIIAGLKNAQLAGRLQSIIYQGKSILLDVAHNDDSFVQLNKYLSDNPVAGKNIAVFGMLSDKDMRGSITRVAMHIDSWKLCSISAGSASDRVGDAQILASIITSDNENANVDCYSSPALAFMSGLSTATVHDRIVVMGSFHTVGDVLKYIKEVKCD